MDLTHSKQSIRKPLLELESWLSVRALAAFSEDPSPVLSSRGSDIFCPPKGPALTCMHTHVIKNKNKVFLKNYYFVQFEEWHYL